MNIRLPDFMDPDVVKSSGTTCDAETLEMQRLCFDTFVVCVWFEMQRVQHQLPYQSRFSSVIISGVPGYCPTADAVPQLQSVV